MTDKTLAHLDALTGSQILIYGANGYTGKLIARVARERGWSPVLGGRNRQEIEALGQAMGLPVRCFGLNNASEINLGLSGMRIVIHAAGPFSATSAPMLEGCLRVGAHYLDITGELDVFEKIFTRESDAVRAGCVVIPGVGFDVVPTDCVALALHRQLPDATHLELAFYGKGKISPGTMKTMIESLHLPTQVRRSGRIELQTPPLPPKEIDFKGKRVWCAPISWGDVSTAFKSTGIPNITVYTGMPKSVGNLMAQIRRLGPLLRFPLVQAVLKELVVHLVHGSNDEELREGYALVWCEARTDDGRAVSMTIKTVHPYELTARSAVAAAARLMTGDIKPGVYTPSLAFGPEFLFTIEGTERL